MAAQLDAVLAREVEQRRTEKRWTPLPHQVPPPGDWRGWLMMAGRGAGKTEGCAKYMSDHVHVPPCIDGPVPHWMAIIAPTLGDAATACYSGPSGIRSFDADAVMASRIGGLLIQWPNGSQAKMYGAREPDDVERLRAGGNVCVSRHTPIATVRGDIPIQDVVVGDQVLTRRGYRRVLAVWDNGVRPVYEVQLVDGKRLVATGDHKVHTIGGWQRIDELSTCSKLTTWRRDKSLSMPAFGGMSVAKATSLTHDEDCFIDTSGHSITDRYRRSTSFIINSRMIKIQRTSRVSYARRRNDTPIIMNVGMTRNADDVPDVSVVRHGREIYRLKIERPSTAVGVSGVISNLTVSTVTRSTVTRISIGMNDVSRVVAQSAPRRSHARRSLLQRNAQRGVDWRSSGESVRVRNTPSVPVSCAASYSRVMSRTKPELALVSVRAVRPCGYEMRVYDLTVEGEHEFFAGGICAHNCLSWLEELAAWRYLQDAFDQMRFGLRIGPHPRWIASTTPKPRALIKKLYKGEIRGVALTHATMYDNPHLGDDFKNAVEESYAGTSLGTQELYGKLVEQDTNALWTRDTLERTRLVVAPPLQAIEVGVDPSGGAGEQGIIVVGRADEQTAEKRVLKHGYVLHDASVRMKPEGWARTAVTTAVDWDANRLVVETNFGGDQAVALLVNACDQLGVHVPIRTVHASRGKQPRAQPVSAMSAQNRWHMVGYFDELEDQMATWTVGSGWSPDRIDAMVWPAWSMKLVSTIFKTVGSWGGSQMVHRTLGRRRRS